MPPRPVSATDSLDEAVNNFHHVATTLKGENMFFIIGIYWLSIPLSHFIPRRVALRVRIIEVICWFELGWPVRCFIECIFPRSLDVKLKIWAKISKCGKWRKSMFCNNFFKIGQKLILWKAFIEKSHVFTTIASFMFFSFHDHSREIRHDHSHHRRLITAESKYGKTSCPPGQHTVTSRLATSRYRGFSYFLESLGLENSYRSGSKYGRTRPT